MKLRWSITFLFLLPAWAQAPADLEAVVTTDLGTFRFEFAPDKAPKHVEQFIRLARQGYYDGSAFHRVIANGVIQGGDPLLKDPKTAKNLWGTGGLNLLATEFSDMKHERGVVSTVRLPNKSNSDGSQFFVCVVAQPPLDGQYSAFGRVTEGMDVVEKISQVPADGNAFTDKPVRILKVTIENKKVQPFLTATPDEMRKTVTLRTTLGNIRIAMEPDWAPNTVRNFLMLTETRWYNGTIFHRIVKDFVVQGGTADKRASGPTHPADRWVHPIQGEFRGDVKHVRGIVSMARGDDPNSATTSFFLMLGPASHLDGEYAAFGRIVEGMEVLDAFEKEELDGETPKRRLEIIEATIDK
ncbi:MAG TPA: peptidylprolyl isomerase [Bryobacteraceae bacterium]|nr:peptidylprolyl isomerase [Bryobacteraceae bacterium]